MASRDFMKEVAFSSDQYSRAKEYWLNNLSGDFVRSSFPYDFNKTYGNNGDGTSHHIGTWGMVQGKISGELFEKLIRIINNSDLRLFMIIVTALVLLLSKYTGHTDIVVGAPLEKQDNEGDFINTSVALRIRLSRGMTFKELLLQVKQVVLDAYRNQNFPLETIPYELNMEVSENDAFPLLDTAILLENLHERSYINHIKLNMVFSFLKTDESIKAVVEYNTSLYEKETIQRIINHFIHTLHRSFINVDASIADVDILSEEEKRHLMVEINNTRAAYPQSRVLHELFEEQVEKIPGNIAIKEADTGRRISYFELNERANQLADLLREKGVKPGTAAAIMGERKLEIVIGIMAVLKAGGGFLPLDAQNPDKRIQFILKDSRAHIFLSQEHIIEQRREIFQELPPGNIIALDDQSLYQGNAKNPTVNTEPTDPAYIIYTSGTTGKPKGVVVEHKSLVNYIHFARNNYVKEEQINFPLYTSIGFDLTITSIFTPLLTGNAVVVYSGWNKGNLIERIIDDNHVGAVKLTPSHLYLIQDKKITASNAPQEGNSQGKIKRFIVGGEKLEYQLAWEINNNFNGKIEIYNEYGPTEATVGCMLYKFDPGQHDGRSVPIGLPADNTQVYLLDKNFNLVPTGAIGEIYISGCGLARGYLNRPELTAEKFRPVSFRFYRSYGSYMTYIPKKIYKTGDLARWLKDGNIEFLGRIDQQVKIRGFRIELEEIQNRLLEHNDIKEAIVIVKETLIGITNGDQKQDQVLCAYIVSDKELSNSHLRDYLSGKLPDYMVPSHFITLGVLPLTPNGKVDRKALPEPGIRVETQFMPPRNDIEKKLGEIWGAVLGIKAEDIGIDSNFFELGGHSLSATVLVTRIHKVFSVRLLLVEIFKLPTIRELSGKLVAAEKERFVPIEPVEKREYYVLSSIQRRLYILQQMDLESRAYNIPELIVLEGILDMERFERTFKKIIRRHESFRTSFEVQDNEPVQRIYDYHDVSFSIAYFESDEGRVDEILKSLQEPFDLSQAPILRVGLIKIKEYRHLLVMEMHHIMSDGTSMIILTKEFMQWYEDKDFQLSPLKIQYRDFSEWQNNEQQIETKRKQEVYWLNVFERDIPVLNLRTDYARPSVQRFAGALLIFTIEKEQRAQLHTLTSEKEVTLFMLLLAIFNVFLSHISRQKDIVVGVPVEGRRHEDLRNIIGMFVNTLPLRNYPEGHKSFSEFLMEIRQRTLEAFENQDYPFEEMVDQLAIDRDASRNPLFDVMFQLENLNLPEIEIPGLTLKPYKNERRVSKFDLTLYGQEMEEELFLVFEYNTLLFKKEKIQWFSDCLKEIITAVLKDPDKKLSEIVIMTEKEKVEKLSQLTADLECE